MTRPALRAVPPQHPLQDRDRLDKVTNLMWIRIQKVLFGPGTTAAERAIHGGVSVEDVLQQALHEVLRYRPPPPQRLDDVGWEGLAVARAELRAIDAVERAVKHRRLPDGSEIHVGSIDEESSEGNAAPTPIETLPDPAAVNEEELVDSILEAERAQRLQRVAEQILNEREREVVDRISAARETRAEIGEDLGVSRPRIDQIYKRALEKLLTALQDDPEFQSLMDSDDGSEMT